MSRYVISTVFTFLRHSIIQASSSWQSTRNHIKCDPFDAISTVCTVPHHSTIQQSFSGRSDPPDFSNILNTPHGGTRALRATICYTCWPQSFISFIILCLCCIGHNMKLNKASQWVLGTVGWCAQPNQYGCSRNELPYSFFS